MACCVLAINESRSKDFQKFHLEGIPNPPNRRSLAECAKEILEIARKIIDVKLKDSQEEMKNINMQRAMIPQIIENSKSNAASQGVKFSPKDEFIAFSNAEFTEIVYQFGPLFEPKAT